MRSRTLAFASAFLMLIGGVLGGHAIVAAVLGNDGFHHSAQVASGLGTRPSLPRMQPTSPPAPTSPPTIAAEPSPTTLPTPARHIAPASGTPSGTGRGRVLPTAAPLSTPVAPPLSALNAGAGAPALAPRPPVQAAGSGVITLVNYWVNPEHARPGQTLAIGYVVSNGTGVTARVVLGASIKSVRMPGWASGALSDPAHDVVAIVPPGLTTHLRFFRLPSGLRPGVYDVAWGLRDPQSGQRVALVAAAGVLHVKG